MYFANLWNYVELANLTAYVITMVMWFVTVNKHNFDTFKNRDPDNFKDLYVVAKDFAFGTTLASFNLVYGFVRFFKYFRVYAKFRMFWDSLSVAVPMILPLLFVFVFFTFAFTFSGHWLFGHRVARFSSISETLVYVVLSMKDGIDLDEIQDVAPSTAPFWY